MISIVTRAGKGAPLTHAEMDTNLTNLKTAVENAAVTDNYGAVVKADAPVGFWRLSEASGPTTLEDASGNGYNATIASGSPLPVKHVNAKRGALYLPTSFVATFPAAMCQAATAGSGLSFEMITLQGSTGVAYAAVMDLWSISNSTQAEYRFSNGWAGAGVMPAMMIGDATDSNFLTAISPFALPCGQWFHVVGTYDLANIRLYINGVLVATQAQTTALVPATNGGIGTSAYADRLNNASFAELAIYNKCLTAAQVAAHYAEMGN